MPGIGDTRYRAKITKIRGEALDSTGPLRRKEGAQHRQLVKINNKVHFILFSRPRLFARPLSGIRERERERGIRPSNTCANKSGT